LLAATSVSRENALAPFASLFPEQYDPREPKFDCSATTRAIEPFGLVCPPANHDLFAVYLRSLRERGALPTPVEMSA
jgi:hypothetical protein